MITVFLLVLSNIFMTVAWYGHLKYTNFPLWTVIIVSWLIALPEYCFQVPANRLGYGQFSGVELKTIQEIISLTVFSVFSVLYLNEQFRWNYLVGFAFLVVGAFFIFRK
ncbi:MAG: DMT family protein [Candidatus Dadabacteria bacterium]